MTAQDTSEFAVFLRTLRQRIPPDAATLGPWSRLPVRRGRRVTQEEVAELVGVSRNWYRRLESGVGVRASTKLLDRLATAFAFTPEERVQLFVLGIPEIRQTRLEPITRSGNFAHVFRL
jgi:DNA-binding XRE family transcriptional regulator